MKHFIDKKGRLNKELLRIYVLDELKSYLAGIQALFYDQNHVFLNRLHDGISLYGNGDPALRKIESYLVTLPDFIKSYIETAVDSPERLEFFIQVKASELTETDPVKAYYWAQLIRHDQLLSVVAVVAKIYDLLQKWFDLPIEKLLRNKAFLAFKQQSIEEMIYLKAEDFYKARS